MRFHDFNARSIGYLGRRALLALAAVAGAALTSAPAAAVPAQPGLRSFPLNATGAMFDAEVIGDEDFDYIKTPEGTIVVRDPTSGTYQVAAVALDATGGKILIPSGTRVASLTTYGGRVSPSTLPVIDDETLNEIWEAAAAHGAPQLPFTAPSLTTGVTTRPMLTIIVEFTQGTTGTVVPPGAFDGLSKAGLTHWTQTMYGYNPGSVNHYYADMSLGQFMFAPAAETQGTAGDGVVKVRLPVPHPNSKKDHATTQIYLKQALALANPYVNFASYDTNGDGEIHGNELNVVFVLAGYESANTSKEPSVWAHAKGFYDPPTLDGKILSGYVALGEVQRHKVNGVLTDVPATLGVLVHELGHAAVGLPDLYKGPTPLGIWCLMAGGSWGSQTGEHSGTTPTAMSAWARIKTGFLAPTVIEPGSPSQVIALAQTAGTELFGVDVDPTIYRINTSNPQRYFLIDNRQNEGYDRGLQHSVNFTSVSGGLAVYRVDEARSAGNGKIAVMADNSASPSKIGALYNQEGGNVFTPFSDPSSDDGDGYFTGLSVTGLSAAGPIMFATVGYQPFDCHAITAPVAEHLIHGRALPLVFGEFFAGYQARGSHDPLGFEKNAAVTLHVEAPGYWSVGACP